MLYNAQNMGVFLCTSLKFQIAMPMNNGIYSMYIAKYLRCGANYDNNINLYE